MIVSKIKAECDWIINQNTSALDKLDKIHDFFLSEAAPKNLNWTDSQNVVIAYRREFEELCISLMTHGIPEPQEMSVFRFITAIKHFETKKPNPTK